MTAALSQRGSWTGGTLPTVHFDPTTEHPPYETMLRHGVGWWPQCPPAGAVLVASYPLVREVLSDPRRFSSATSIGQPLTWATTPAMAAAAAGLPPQPTMVINTDGDRHTRLRSIYGAGFRGYIKTRSELMWTAAHELANQILAAGGGDLAPGVHGYFARVINDVFGFPAADVDRIDEFCRAVTVRLNPSLPEQDQLAAIETLHQALAYVTDLVDQSRRGDRPERGTLIDDLVHGRHGNTRMTDEEIGWTVVISRVAATETSEYALLDSIDRMLRNGLWAQARAADPPARDRIIMGSIAEALRTGGQHGGLLRITTCDTQLGGHTIPAGTQVFPSLAAANLDPSVFPDPAARRAPDLAAPDPHVMDIERPDRHTHLTFGHGVHRCVGARLALTEIEIAVTALIQRLPNLALARPHERHPVRHPLFNGLRRLDVVCQP